MGSLRFLKYKITRVKVEHKFSELERSIIYVIMLNMNLVPFDGIDTNMTNVGFILKKIDPKQSRIMRRKFRKIWVRCAKIRLNELSESMSNVKKRQTYIDNQLLQTYGYRSFKPTNQQMYRRRQRN